jgi:hypothetical protein
VKNTARRKRYENETLKCKRNGRIDYKKGRKTDVNIKEKKQRREEFL